jgi:hypothetical protein
MPPLSCLSRLAVHDLADLRRSGLTDTTIANAGAYTETDPGKLADLLNRATSSNPWLRGGALVLPYFDADGKRNGYVRVKPRWPRLDKQGKQVKYEAPLYVPNHAYIVPAVRRLLNEGAARVLVTEGEKKCLALVQDGHAAVGLSGVYCWKLKGSEELLPDLAALNWRKRTALLLFDFDANSETRRYVEDAARRLSHALMRAGAEKVLYVRLPPGERLTKQGVDDFLVAHGPEALAELLRRPEAFSIDSVMVGLDEHRVNKEAESILAANARDLYQRGKELVQVLHHRDDGRKQRVRRDDGAPVLRLLPAATLREELTRYVRFMMATKQGPQPTGVPGHVVPAISARGVWPDFRHLEGVVSHPVLLPDGGVLAEPGFDADSGLLLWLPPDLRVAVPEAPTREDALRARDLLLDVVADFPFRAEVHKAAWLCAVLTPLARFAFEGPAPLFVADGNAAGVGKGLLLDVAFLIVSGRRASVAVYTDDRAELRKAITTLAVAGDELVLLDNIVGNFGNDVLDGALTATHWRDRILGYNKRYDGPLVLTWYATGNNMVVVGDTARRLLHIRLETDLERPEERADMREPDLRAYVKRNRGALLSAALTVLRAYCQAGRPDQQLTPWGSFEGWSALVRSAVVWLDLPDPWEGRHELRRASSPEADALATLFAGLAHLDPEGHGLTAAAVLRLVEFPGMDEVKTALKEALPDLFPNRTRSGPITPQVFGMKLRHLRNKVLGDRRLERLGEDDHTTGVRWRVVPTGATGATGAVPTQYQVGTGATGANSAPPMREEVDAEGDSAAGADPVLSEGSPRSPRSDPVMSGNSPRGPRSPRSSSTGLVEALRAMSAAERRAIGVGDPQDQEGEGSGL